MSIVARLKRFYRRNRSKLKTTLARRIRPPFTCSIRRGNLSG